MDPTRHWFVRSLSFCQFDSNRANGLVRWLCVAILLSASVYASTYASWYKRVWQPLTSCTLVAMGALLIHVMLSLKLLTVRLCVCVSLQRRVC